MKFKKKKTKKPKIKKMKDKEVNYMKIIDITTVPWFNKNEWISVYDFIYSDTPQREKAIEILKMWKMRNTNLSAGIEGTFIILQALDKLSKNIDEYDLQVLYSTAILRFLNVCAAHDKKQGTFYSNAKTANIPEWIIDIRHEIAHGTNLPPFHSLKKTCDFAFNWLYEHYWHPVSILIQDYAYEKNDVQEKKKSLLNNQDEFSFLVNSFECLAIFQHSNFNFKTIRDIPDIESRNDLLNDLKNFKLISNITENTFLSVLSKTVISVFLEYLHMTNMNSKSQIIDDFLRGMGFLCDEDLQMQLFDSTSLEVLPWNYVSLWVELLQVFYKFSMIEDLLKKLFEKISSKDENEYRKKMASLWIIEISKGLKKVQLAQIVIETEQVSEKESNTNRQECVKYVIQKTEAVHPALKHIITFDPFINIPSIVSDFKKFSKIVLNEPNVYTRSCLPFVLELITPKLNSNLTAQLYKLIDSFVNPENITGHENKSDETVYSIKDIRKKLASLSQDDELGIKINTKTTLRKNHSMSTEDLEMQMDCNSINENDIEENHWKITSEHLNFHTCPIGILPWQDSTKNPVLQSFLES